MCGLAGAWELESTRPAAELDDIVGRMAGRLDHRGPDDAGTWVDERAGFGIGHRRLSIVDLSAQGHQPMVSRSGRFVLGYNGEVYNHDEIRKELRGRGVSFRGLSDTEVLLEACERWGVPETLSRLNGMFAFALWDREERQLSLARDRLGIKPLFLAQHGSTVLFASEASALREHPSFVPEIDRDALAAFFRRNCIPAPLSIYAGVRKLSPGSLVTVRPDGSAATASYWSLAEVAQRTAASRDRTVDLEEVTSGLEDVLSDAVRLRMLADVPVGAFLSGGIDSSTVVALMQTHASSPVRTFSIGFADHDYDESGNAAEIARYLGTDHYAMTLTRRDVARLIPEFAGVGDEPFADSSYLPTRVVSEMARQQVTVSLSGDGGDELFAGYTRHKVAGSRLGAAFKVPSGIRGMASRGMIRIPAERWDRLGRWLPASAQLPRLGDQIHKAAHALAAADLQAFYDMVSTHWDGTELVLDADEPSTWDLPGNLGGSTLDPVHEMLLRDTTGYLPDDILTKVDRASMAVSLEARVPLLDHRVVEFAWGIPQSAKVNGQGTKQPLRHLLASYVPPELWSRPKQGFGIPFGPLLREELADWVGDLTSPDLVSRQGLLDPNAVSTCVKAANAGDPAERYRLWDVLCFQAWFQEHHSE